MLRANLTEVFIVDKSYQHIVDFFKKLNHSLVSLSDKELIFTTNNFSHKFKLTYREEDIFTKTFLSQFVDDTPFRVIKPIGFTKEISLKKNNSKDGFSVGSINPDGYSVTFILTEKNDIRDVTIKIKGVEEQLQKLITGAMMALQNNLNTDFYTISRRLIANISANKIHIKQFEYGSLIAQILKDNLHLYDEIEQDVIRQM